MPDGYVSLTVSVDALEWTRHWLGKRRCDLLSVFLATSPAATPQVRIVAVESKGRTEREPLAVRRSSEPFGEAVTQVVATLDALHEALAPDTEASIFADLKLSAFVEHLTSETLSRLSPILANEDRKLHVLRVLTGLSRRTLSVGSGVELAGLAVVTQRNATVPTEEISIVERGTRGDWNVRLVRCGIPLVRQLLQNETIDVTPSPVNDDERSDAADVAEQRAEHGRGNEPAPVPIDAEPLDDQSVARLFQLEAACRLRGFRVGTVSPELAANGPTLISVSVELAAGESIRPIQSATSDIARELGVTAVAVENDPDRPYHVRFLIPRAERQFPTIPANTPLLVDQASEQYLGIWMGAGVDGTPYRAFLSSWPHLLVAGTTGSGKTTFLRSLLQQVDGAPVGDIQVVVVDGKGEYDYMDLVRPQHFALEFPEVQLGYEHATSVLRWLVEVEVTRRREILRQYFSTHRDTPRAPRQAYVRARALNEPFPLAPIVVVIDEFAEIMLAAGASAREFEDLVQRVVQAGRSALVHLVLATQRPDANVLPGAIKANMPSRVALSLPSHHDSMTVLNSPGAEGLLGSGDMLFQASSGERLRLQAFRPTV